MSQNNSYLVPKIGTKKTQVLHRIRLRQFTTRQSSAEVQITPEDGKFDPEVSIKHLDLYARA